MIRPPLALTGYGLAVLIPLLVLLPMSGASLSTTVWTTLYFGLFFLLPGLSVLVRTRWFGSRASLNLIWSLAVGVAIHPVWLTITWLLGSLKLAWLVPLAALLHLSTKYRDLASYFRSWIAQSCTLESLCRTSALSILTFFTAWLGTIFPFAGPMINDHFVHQALVARTLEGGWPPINLLAEGAPLSYNFATHLSMLLASKLLPMDLLEVSARVFPVLFLEIAILVMLAFGRTVIGLRWLYASLAVVSTFWVVGYGPINFKVFGSVVPSAATLVISPLVGFVIFVVALRFLLSRDSISPAVAGTIAFFLAFSLTGVRSPFGAVLICVVAALLARSIWRRSLVASSAASLCGVLFGTALAMKIFLAWGNGFSAGSFILIGQTFTWLSDLKIYYAIELLKGYRVPPIIAGGFGFLIMALMSAEFLVAGFIFECFQAIRRCSSRQYILLAVSAAGIVGTMITQAPGGSHFSFMHLANLSTSWLGAMGIQRAVGRLVNARGAARRWAERIVVLGVLVVVPLSAYDLYRQLALYKKQLFVKPVYYLPADLAALSRHLTPKDRVVLLVSEADTWIHTIACMELAARTGVQLIAEPVFTRHYITWNPGMSDVFRRRTEYLTQAQEAVSRGELSADIIRAMRSTLVQPVDQVFVLAPEAVRVVGDMDRIDTAGRYALYRLSR